MKSKNPKPLTDNQRIEFTKNIEQLFEASYANWRRMLTMSFLRGIATGLGVFLGGTIIVGLLLWVLSGLGHIPFLTNITHAVQGTLDQGDN